jgi:hypothetical protein
VNHEILLHKLHIYGIQGVSEDWFRSHFTNRRQKVEEKSPNKQAIYYRPVGFQEVEAPRFLDNQHMKVVRLSALSTGRLYPPGNTLVLISIGG